MKQIKKKHQGANPASWMSNAKRLRCDQCHKLMPISQLWEIHALIEIIGDKHRVICEACEIPAGWYVCGCGG